MRVCCVNCGSLFLVSLAGMREHTMCPACSGPPDAGPEKPPKAEPKAKGSAKKGK